MNLREARRAKNISQVDLAKLAGVDQTTISALEVGRNQNPSWATVLRLAQALDVTPEELFPVPPIADADSGEAA